jgi:formylglycine-generating enzyme required for sulfatase activity/serine/threonine protein kinase
LPSPANSEDSGSDVPPSDSESLSRRIRAALPQPLGAGSRAFFRGGERARPQPAPGLAPGKVVGDFRLIALIGQGGMGQVWEAEQVSLHRRVAVKFVRTERVTERQLELFAREARAGGRLHHPGIVTVHGYGQSDGLAWIAMEHVEGAWTLKDFLDEAARAAEVPEGYDRHVAHLVAEIAEAMQAAHEAGVIHRDLKPQNVLITSEDRPKVTDFGLARITDETALSQTGDFAGTYFYMSPEQVTARRMGIDHRTDVFSLGVVLYELLALRRPFEGDTSHQVAAQIVTKDPPDIRTIRSRVPRDLAVIAGKALEKDRDKRFQRMADLAADLRRHLADEPILAKPPTRFERVVKWTRRHPGKSSAAAIVAVTFTIIAVLLVANVQKTRALATANTELAATAQREKAAAERADREAEAAKASEQRAREEAARAEQKAEEVLRLSALQKLEDLVAEADRLWPAHPENIARYEAWLARAEALVGELPDHERKLAELRARSVPWTEEEQAKQRAEHPKLVELESAQRHVEHHRKLRAALQSSAPAPDPRPEEVGVDLTSLPSDANEVNGLAWDLIDPEREDWGGEAKGLVLARRAVELAAELLPEERAGIRDSLAWALFANGRFDEAVAEEEQALEEAAADKKQEFEGYLAKLKKKVEEEIDPEKETDREKHLTEITARIAELEAEISVRPEWLFADAQDKWWHNQLEKLVSGLESFSNEKTGLFSDGTSLEHGWGLKKRLAFAVTLRDGFAGGQYAEAWSEAMPKLEAAYPGLTLTPQIGLVPIGPDPESKLWEFAHLATGEPAVRGPDGKLVLKEETGLVFVLLPGGPFQMGAQKGDPSGPNYDPQAEGNEGPVHPVTLSAFFLSKYEMTQGQWQRFTGRNPSDYRPPGGLAPSLLHPVEQVSWTTCMETCERLGLSLPSEAQWEYGARAGTTSVWWTGSERDSLLGAVNLADQAAARAGAPWSDIKDWPELDDGYAVHAPVNQFRGNAFGLHNVHGNVWEWCLDGYDSGFYGRPASKDPWSPPKGSSIRVIRGGSFDNAASYARSANRPVATPELADGHLGLRPIRRISP